MRKIALLGASFFVQVCVALQAGAQVQTDFNEDSTSDVLYYSTSSGLHWTSVPSGGSGTTVDEDFGQATDYACPAHWLDSSGTDLAFVRSGTSQNLTWKVSLGSGLEMAHTFGKTGDVVVSGGDFDGDGVSDAAIVHVVNGNLRWTVKTAFFGSGGTTKRLRCGVSGDRVFYINPDGERDWAAAFGKDSRNRARLLLCDTQSRARRTVRRGFPRSLTRSPRPRPFPVAQADGSDLVVFVLDDGVDTTRLRAYTTTGTRVFAQDFTGIGSSFVGDFISSADGEEVALQTSSRLTFVNPGTSETDTASIVSGTPIDEVNIINTVAATPTATPTATATVAPTPTI